MSREKYDRNENVPGGFASLTRHFGNPRGAMGGYTVTGMIAAAYLIGEIGIRIP